MKLLLVATFSLLFALSCTEKKKEKSDMMPVEADNSIGDGAPSLDSILQEENNSLISQEKSDSITNSYKRDSI